MYFHDRAEAGDLLANQLVAYRYENTAVLALSPGGVLVGEQIARRLHCPMSMLLAQPITPPGEESLVLGAVDEQGTYTPNEGLLEETMVGYLEEWRGYVEEEKVRRIAEMVRLYGEYGEPRPEQLAGRVVILACDGLVNGASILAATRYLALLKVERIIAAVPVGTFEAIEQASRQVDELHYLYIPDQFFDVDHYYTENPRPTKEDLALRINTVVAHWL